MFFREEIGGLHDWAKVFGKKEIFEPMIKAILKKHRLEYGTVENCAPGSNAVFKVGGYIVKIFAPEEAQIGDAADFYTEKFGIARANSLGISAPRLLGDGEIDDKYLFRYLILEYVEGDSLADISGSLSVRERQTIGMRLRNIVDKMDTPCENFNTHTLSGARAEQRWTVFSKRFLEERKELLKRCAVTEPVYNHGDLNPDNILVDRQLNLYLIDFADALLAPVELEIAGLVCDGFKFDPAYLKGFFGKYDKNELTEKLLYGILIHDYGVNIIRDNIAEVSGVASVHDLRRLIAQKL